MTWVASGHEPDVLPARQPSFCAPPPGGADGVGGLSQTEGVPELSLTTLTWINGILFVLYLPLGFMG